MREDQPGRGLQRPGQRPRQHHEQRPGERLRTERLVLREFTAEDADLLIALDSDPEVMRYITGGVPTPRSRIVDDILPRWLSWYSQPEPGLGFWAAEDHGGAFLGWFHLRPGPGHRPDEPELGYRLRRTAWGRGLATEGGRALVDSAFADLGARRVLAQTLVINTPSRRVMEHLGMRPCRVFHGGWPIRTPGDELGDIEYEITVERWREISHLRQPQVS